MPRATSRLQGRRFMSEESHLIHSVAPGCAHLNPYLGCLYFGTLRFWRGEGATIPAPTPAVPSYRTRLAQQWAFLFLRLVHGSHSTRLPTFASSPNDNKHSLKAGRLGHDVLVTSVFAYLRVLASEPRSAIPA